MLKKSVCKTKKRSAKTADEMFRELGYEKTINNECWIAYKVKFPVFEEEYQINIIKSVQRVEKVCTSYDGGIVVPMSFKELNACAKAMEEMGVLQ